MPRYDQDKIEIEAITSARIGRITEPLGTFILQRALEIAGLSVCYRW